MKISNLMSGLATILLLGAVGCAAEPGGGGADDEQDVSRAEQAWSVWQGPHGGGGGNEFVTSNYLDVPFYGVDLMCGSNVDKLKMLGYWGYSFGPFGGSGGSPLQVRCNSGDVVVGIAGRADDSSVTGLVVICGNTYGYTYGSAACGWAGEGSPFENVCPPGQYVTRVRGRSGAWLDRIEIACGKTNIVW